VAYIAAFHFLLFEILDVFLWAVLLVLSILCTIVNKAFKLSIEESSTIPFASDFGQGFV